MAIEAAIARRFAQIAEAALARSGAGAASAPGGMDAIGGAAAVVPGAPRADSASFGATLQRALEEVSMAQETANDQMQAFLRGEPVELHQVMAATEEAGIALEMLIEVRNKFTEAYRTVINMQS